MEIKKDRFYWRPLGGLNRIGMNVMVMHFGDTAVPVDAGVMFAEPNDFGVQSILPDYSKLLNEHRPKYWFITHAHEDHIGSVGGVLQYCFDNNLTPPIFVMPDYAILLLKDSLKDHGGFPAAKKYINQFVSINDQDFKFQISEGLSVEYLRVRHSIADSYALRFHWDSPNGDLRLLHTSDFKIDDNAYPDGVIDENSMNPGNPDIDIAFVDSTNSLEEKHSKSEVEVAKDLEIFIKSLEGRLFVTSFSSNLYRLANLIAMAPSLNRYVYLSGRSMCRAYRIARELDLFSNALPAIDTSRVLEGEEFKQVPPEKQMIIGSGSQGEPGSMLWKMGREKHGIFRVQKSDQIVFTSKLIPGNERNVYATVNDLTRLGASIHLANEIEKSRGLSIHASGHASAVEIRKVLDVVKPKHMIPVHGELRHLIANSKLALECGIPEKNIHVIENGGCLEFVNKTSKWELQSKQEGTFDELILRFENYLTGSRSDFMYQRKALAKSGVLMASLNVSGNTQVSSWGLLPKEETTRAVEEEIQHWLYDQFRKYKKKGHMSEDNVDWMQGEIEKSLIKHLRSVVGSRKPVVIFHFLKG